DGELVVARPPTLAYRARKYARKHRVPIAICVLLAVSTAVSTGLFLDARRQRETAESRKNEAEVARSEAQSERDQALRLAGAQRLRDLQTEAEALWPAESSRVVALEAWLSRARELAGRIGKHEETLAALREKAEPRTNVQIAIDREDHPKAAALKILQARLEATKKPGAADAAAE